MIELAARRVARDGGTLDTPEALDARLRAAASDFDESWVVLVEAITAAEHNQIHTALGFETWSDYVTDVVQMNMPHVARSVEQRRGLVELLVAEGMSQRAIGAVIGVSQSTVRNDVAWASTKYSADGATPLADVEQVGQPDGDADQHVVDQPVEDTAPGPSGTGPSRKVRKTAGARKTMNHLAITVNSFVTVLDDTDPAEVDLEKHLDDIKQIRTGLTAIRRFLNAVEGQEAKAAQ